MRPLRTSLVLTIFVVGLMAAAHLAVAGAVAEAEGETEADAAPGDEQEPEPEPMAMGRTWGGGIVGNKNPRPPPQRPRPVTQKQPPRPRRAWSKLGRGYSLYGRSATREPAIAGQ